MPIAIISTDGAKRLGKVFDDVLIDLTVAAPGLPGIVIEFLTEGEVGTNLPSKLMLARRSHKLAASIQRFVAHAETVAARWAKPAEQPQSLPVAA